VGSWLADAGVPPHDIAAILGHRDAGFTLRTHVHSLPDALRRALTRWTTRSAAGRERAR
jgi:integrase